MNPPSTPTGPKRREYDTPHRARFFHAYFHKQKRTSLGQICRRKDIGIPTSTARSWLRKYDQIGPSAVRSTRNQSNNFGRPRVLDMKQLEALLSPSHSSHHLNYEGIVKAEDFNVTPYTLRRNLATRLGARRYKKPRSKAISKKNRALRVQYGEIHQNKRITSFWQYVYFTDEAHFNSKDLSDAPAFELRRESGEIRRSCINETQASKLDITVHIAAGISYNSKGIFEFYNDPKEPSMPRTYRPRMPRKSSVQSAEEYQQVVRDWEASKPPNLEIKPAGNSMTQQ